MDNRERADLREIAIQVLDDINGECGVGNETSVIYDEKGDYAGWAPEVIEAAEQAISRALASALAQRDADVLAEREHCALVAENVPYAMRDGGMTLSGFIAARDCAEIIAEEIRARTASPSPSAETEA